MEVGHLSPRTLKDLPCQSTDKKKDFSTHQLSLDVVLYDWRLLSYLFSRNRRCRKGSGQLGAFFLIVMKKQVSTQKISILDLSS